MPDPLSRAERIRKEAAKISHLAESASRRSFATTIGDLLSGTSRWKGNGYQRAYKVAPSQNVTAFLSLTSDTLRRRDLTGHDHQGRREAEATVLKFFVCVILGISCRVMKIRGSAFPHIWGVRLWVGRSLFCSWMMMPRSPMRPRALSKAWECAPSWRWGPCPRLTFSRVMRLM